MAKPDQYVDELFEVRNAFYMGNYQQCIKEALKVKTTADESTKLTRDVFMYRAYICQKKYSIILDEISPASSTPVELRAVRLFAEYLNSDGHHRSKLVATVEQKLKQGAAEFDNNVFYLLASQIFVYEGCVEEALRILQNGDDLECDSAIVQYLLKMDRDDLAAKHVKKMQEKDDDSILTQLSMAWSYMSLGKEKLQDAFYIYQEMIDKYGGTPLLLNAQASVLIMQEKYDQADKFLQEAMDKDSNNPEALINSIVVSRHLGKSFEICNRFVNQLKDGFPKHPWTKEYCSKEDEFDRLCVQYEVNKA